jgi:1-acyl-sn-glycerol-3-phosphate acyltransferase
MLSIFRNPEPLYRWCVKVFVRTVYRIDYVDFDQIPDEGPVMIIANHVSYMDGLVINAGINRPIRYVIYEDIYRLPVVNYFMRQNRAIPILPNRESVTKALEEIAKGLEAGDAICIFPEGQISYTGNMTRFRFGIEWMIKTTPVTVYPVALKGLWGSIFSRKYRKQPFYKRFIPTMFRRNIVAVCGKPITPEKVAVSHLQHIIMTLKNSVDMKRR